MKNIYVSKGIVSARCISSHRSTIKIFQSGPVEISLRPFVSPSPPKRDYVKGCSSEIRNGDWYTAYRNTGGGEGGRGGVRVMCGREMEGKGERGKRVGGRLERAGARGQVATKNQGTSEPPRSHARNFQLPPSRPKRYTYTLLLEPRLDSRQAGGGSTLEKRITRLGNVGHTRGPDRCVRLVRNLNITTVSLRGPVPRTGPLRGHPSSPLALA